MHKALLTEYDKSTLGSIRAFGKGLHKTGVAVGKSCGAQFQIVFVQVRFQSQALFRKNLQKSSCGGFVNGKSTHASRYFHAAFRGFKGLAVVGGVLSAGGKNRYTT